MVKSIPFSPPLLPLSCVTERWLSPRGGEQQAACRSHQPFILQVDKVRDLSPFTLRSILRKSIGVCSVLKSTAGHGSLPSSPRCMADFYLFFIYHPHFVPMGVIIFTVNRRRQSVPGIGGSRGVDGRSMGSFYPYCINTVYHGIWQW